eukprot:scaffold104562_cov26-Tisochrysis_lutea.AAC.4
MHLRNGGQHLGIVHPLGVHLGTARGEQFGAGGERAVRLEALHQRIERVRVIATSVEEIALKVG